MSDGILERTACPGCAGPLDTRASDIRCPGCGARYPRLGRVPVLLPAPQDRLRRWALELALLEREGEAQLVALERTLGSPDLLASSEQRCRAMVQAARQQTADVRAVMLPLLAAAGYDEGRVEPAHIGSPLLRLHYLLRDWGWRADDGGPHPENAQALAAVAAAGQGTPLGRTLVLGGGACRLSLDLHRLGGVGELAVLDLDPVLLGFAQRLLRGEVLPLTELATPVQEAGAVARTWELAGPAAGQGARHLPIHLPIYLFLADGLAPPFHPHSFDTVVTPWFIDNVPGDLRELLGTLARLLRPGGRWINHGPLIYPPALPPARRFTREEIFELAARAGFRIGHVQTASLPHLVSPLTGRGRTEWTLTFAATLEGPPEATAWLLLPHLPVPTFAGQTMFWHDNPLISAVVASIDGRHSIDDMARRLAPEVRQWGLDPGDLKEAIRQCLAAVHPDCRRPG